MSYCSGRQLVCLWHFPGKSAATKLGFDDLLTDPVSFWHICFALPSCTFISLCLLLIFFYFPFCFNTFILYAAQSRFHSSTVQPRLVFFLEISRNNIGNLRQQYIFLLGPLSSSLSQADIFVEINHFLILLDDFNSVQLKAQLGCDPELGVDKVFASVCCPHWLLVPFWTRSVVILLSPLGLGPYTLSRLAAERSHPLLLLIGSWNLRCTLVSVVLQMFGGGGIKLELNE